MGKAVISYCQSTGYHSYMSHNNNVMGHAMFKQLYCCKKSCDPIEFTLTDADMEHDFRSGTTVAARNKT